MGLLTLTRKIPIFPSSEQEQVLWDLSEKCRLLYNFALAERRQNWETNRMKPPKAVCISHIQNNKTTYRGFVVVFEM
jgi:putative transposase